MQIYLVGGAVRDQLLNLPVIERDWVVVGATPEELLTQGFKAVGKDFPVFLHPTTHEEYALARTEKKISKGYKGFSFYASPDISLEEDLLRRDLTINAIAQAEDGTFIDPYHGIADLKAGILRHVSSAFIEDPLRVLRVARFAARFGNFVIAPETLHLMREISNSGELEALVPERIFKELHRALSEKFPQRFFKVLHECEALPHLFPTLNTENFRFLERAIDLTQEPELRFAVLFANSGLAILSDISNRLPLSRNYYQLAELVCRFQNNLLSLQQQSATTVLNFLESVDAFRRPSRFQQFLIVCRAIYGEDPKFLSNLLFLEQTVPLCSSVKPDVCDRPSHGIQIAQEIKTKRLAIIENNLAKNNY